MLSRNNILTLPFLGSISWVLHDSNGLKTTTVLSFVLVDEISFGRWVKKGTLSGIYVIFLHSHYFNFMLYLSHF